MKVRIRLDRIQEEVQEISRKKESGFTG